MPAHLIAEEGPHRGLVLNLETGTEWVIGRDPETCDLVIEDSTVSRKHARLNKTSDGIYLKNLSRTNPALVNDTEVTGPALLLKEGDRVQIGNTVFLFSEEEIPKMEESKPKGGYDDIFGDIEIPKEQIEEAKLPPVPSKPEMTAYDTIFEDSGEEEVVPFNLMSESPLLLKVLGGPNAGAEIGIEKGKIYTLGKDPNSCDVVFQDLSVSRNHARLEVGSDGTITIEDVGSKNGIAVNGSLIGEKKVVTPQDLIALGTTLFMIIDRDAPQETIYSPVASSYEPLKEEAPPPQEEPETPELHWKQKPIPTKYLIVGGSAAAIFLIMFLSFFSLFKPNGMEIARKEPVSEIKEALAKFNDVQFSYNPGSGKLFLVGHVLTNVEHQELNYRLSQIEFISSVEDNVVIDEGVWKMMNDVISTTPAWRAVSIHSPSAGKFVASGFLTSTEEQTRLSEYLTVNFPYLDRLDNQVVVEQTLNTQLQSIIASQRLGSVTFQFANGNLILSGMYNEKMEDELKTLLKELNKVKGVTSVKNFAVAVPPNQAGIDLSQQYQVTGTSIYEGKGYSVVMNGKIYTLGDQIDGMKITSIEPSTILLEKDGLKYKIGYTR